MSPGKTETALDGLNIFSEILILKFSVQHQPQRMQEEPSLLILFANTEESVWMRCSILRLK
ncbi:MAG: hypothetical protein CVV36_09225 [Candidatus Methanoperedenaceae archaeon HGW-Methanoperedenaceae-1]|nr:MAG: hypothetical protein CVV36_09225 [Candidatus Methanoperedenaceae archaeon HGW-Methanoperedenaceae-1]